jgi:tetratricopeptide (TPR) repeat protein
MSEPLEELLRELNREVIETRGATIKTDHAVRNLSAEFRTLAQRQSERDGRAWVHSATAYVLFAGLSFGGLFAFFRASVSGNQAEVAMARQQTEALEQRMTEIQLELDRRRESERAAYEFHELLVSGRGVDVLERWTNVQGRLTDRATIELFRREIDRIRHSLARDAFEQGTQAGRNQQWESARDAFLRSMAYVDVAPYSPELYFHLAEALYHLDDSATAIRYYDLALEAGRMDRQQSILAHFHRAECLQRAERPLEAIEAYRLFARRFEDHHWSSTARVRVERMEQRHGQGARPAEERSGGSR